MQRPVWAAPDAAVPPIYLVGSRTASWHIWPLDASQDWREHQDARLLRVGWRAHIGVTHIEGDHERYRRRKGADLQPASGQNVKAGGIAYVEAGTGNVDRFPLEALIAGSLSVDPAGELR